MAFKEAEKPAGPAPTIRTSSIEPLPGAVDLFYRFHGLATLLDGISNETHSAELSGYEDPWYVRFEGRGNHRDIHTTSSRYRRPG